MTRIVSQPDHGNKLIDKEGLALSNFQIFIDDVVRQFNLLEAQINPATQLNLFKVADVPDAALSRGALIYVTNQSGGERVAYSNGTNWLTIDTNAIISI